MWELKYGNLGLLEILNCVSLDQKCSRDIPKLKCKQQPYPLKWRDKGNCSEIHSLSELQKKHFKFRQIHRYLRFCRFVYELRRYLGENVCDRRAGFIMVC